MPCVSFSGLLTGSVLLWLISQKYVFDYFQDFIWILVFSIFILWCLDVYHLLFILFNVLYICVSGLMNVFNSRKFYDIFIWNVFYATFSFHTSRIRTMYMFDRWHFLSMLGWSCFIFTSVFLFLCILLIFLFHSSLFILSPFLLSPFPPSFWSTEEWSQGLVHSRKVPYDWISLSAGALCACVDAGEGITCPIALLFFLISLRRSISLKPELVLFLSQIGWPATPRWSSYLHPHLVLVLEFQIHTARPGFLCGCSGWNSSPNASAASTHVYWAISLPPYFECFSFLVFKLTI